MVVDDAMPSASICRNVVNASCTNSCTKMLLPCFVRKPGHARRNSKLNRIEVGQLVVLQILHRMLCCSQNAGSIACKNHCSGVVIFSIHIENGIRGVAGIAVRGQGWPAQRKARKMAREGVCGSVTRAGGRRNLHKNKSRWSFFGQVARQARTTHGSDPLLRGMLGASPPSRTWCQPICRRHVRKPTPRDL